MATYVPPPDPIPEDLWHRRAVIPIGTEMLRDMFGLPDGMRVVSVFADPHSAAIVLGVLSPDLPMVDEATTAPTFPLSRGPARESYYADGKVWYRFGWESIEERRTDIEREADRILATVQRDNLARYLAHGAIVNEDFKHAADSILAGDFLTRDEFKAKYIDEGS